MSKYPTKSLVIATAFAMGLAGCATDEYGNPRSLTRAEKGAIIGASAGVLLGARKGDKKKALLYGLVGGLSGAAVGNYMDNQRKDFEKNLSDEINRGDIEVRKMPENNLMVTMTAQTAFTVDSADISTGFNSTMNKISGIVNKYGKTHLSIVGHTDSTGSDAHNEKLSLRRAEAVKEYMLKKKVIPERLSTYGMGEKEPRANNNTEAGRQMNRRIEIVIEPVVQS